ncbi:MAG: asparagine synthase (glutamine-hydrolyzing) [Cytophagales bacterium]|nr:asparagine synthase (glutamine-hydrolyzing) [Cytophagales bacterium]
MCGIAGMIAFDEVGTTFLPYISEATKALERRGPDSMGIFQEGNIALGHRRLSIIDTSERSNQPMQDESKRYTIVFNGEIYNYLELRHILEREGVPFQTESDTEVVLKAFIFHGAEFLKLLNGFFALAIYDKETQSTFIARDRIGIKPLCFYQDEHRFVFGSEMKALYPFKIQKEIDYTTLYQYLQFNYIAKDSSILQNVQKVTPGTYLVINHREKTVQRESYYTIPYPPVTNTLNTVTHTYYQQKKKLREILEYSVKNRLVSDVPLGAFLSGGIDSSVIVALASKHKKNLKTFSIGYQDNPYFDETEYANLVAKKFRTDHTVFSLTNNDLFEELHNVLDYLDEPFADSSAIPVYILSKKTRQEVKVALSGDGADELFTGYHKHMAEFKVRQGGGINKTITAFHHLWSILPKSRSNAFGNTVRQLHKFSEGSRLSKQDRYWLWCSFANEKQANRLLSNHSRQKISQDLYQDRKSEILSTISEGGDMNEILHTDMLMVLPNDMLQKVDSMSMANSLEVRVPFLSHNVVNFAFTLQEESKITSDIKKRILQGAFREILPSELYDRPKRGFEVPLLQWLRSDLKSLIQDDLLNDDFIKDQDIFKLKEIQKLKKQLFSMNPGDSHARIWGLIVFQWWFKKYMN